MVAKRHTKSQNVLIQVDGDIAVSEAYVTVRLRNRDSSGAVADIVSAGRYLDRWSLRTNGWAIDHRQYVRDIRTSMPVPLSDAGSILSSPGAAVVLSSEPNRSDPSYVLFEFKPADVST